MVLFEPPGGRKGAFMVFSQAAGPFKCFSCPNRIESAYVGRLWGIGFESRDALRSRNPAIATKVLRDAIVRHGGVAFVKVGQEIFFCWKCYMEYTQITNMQFPGRWWTVYKKDNHFPLGVIGDEDPRAASMEAAIREARELWPTLVGNMYLKENRNVG